MSTGNSGRIADPANGQESPLRAARRRRILASALDTFLRDGYRHATMERVAEDASVSKQTLYNYFADKEELFGSLIEAHHTEHNVDELLAALNRIPQGDPAAALLEAAEALFRYADDPTSVGVHRIIAELAAEQPELMMRMRSRFFLKNIEEVRGALERSVAAGRLRALDAEAVAYLLFGVAASCALFRPSAPDPLRERLTTERMAHALAGLLDAGLVRRQPDADGLAERSYCTETIQLPGPLPSALT
jgi:AcrR family transcriptional regulator